MIVLEMIRVVEFYSSAGPTKYTALQDRGTFYKFRAWQMSL